MWQMNLWCGCLMRNLLTNQRVVGVGNKLHVGPLYWFVTALPCILKPGFWKPRALLMALTALELSPLVCVCGGGRIGGWKWERADL